MMEQRRRPIRLKYLGLSRNQVHSDTASALLKAIKNIPTMRFLDLSDNFIKKIDCIEEFLRDNKSLRHLDVSKNELSETALCRINLGAHLTHTHHPSQ